MEKAIHITRLGNLKYFRGGQYQRMYWGVEFCQNLIPTIADTAKVLRFIINNNLRLTLVTPFVTEYGLKRLRKFFAWLNSKVSGCEVIVNDWGVLEILNVEFGNIFEPVFGRLLARQQRDPAIKNVLEKQLPSAVKGRDGKIAIVVHRPPHQRYQKGMRACYANPILIQNLLSKFGIRRIELNNLIQGLDLQGVKFKKSIYTPYVNISTSRFCPMRTRQQKIYRINVCERECQRYYEILRNRAIPKIIYKRGTTTFYKNPLAAKNLSGLDIDRIVFQPELPS
ncbi:hypothetical protein ACFL1I_07505 [Candidatus Omnitrophota bacterium]